MSICEGLGFGECCK